MSIRPRPRGWLWLIAAACLPFPSFLVQLGRCLVGQNTRSVRSTGEPVQNGDVSFSPGLCLDQVQQIRL